MGHGWRGRAGRLLRAGVGVALLCGPTGCFSTDRSKLLEAKRNLPASLPPPSLPAAGPLSSTAPGGKPTPTAARSAEVPAQVASRTPETTPAPTAIPGFNRTATTHAELMEQANALSGARANVTPPVVPSPIPGIQHPEYSRPAVQPVAAVQHAPAEAPRELPIAETPILPPSPPAMRIPDLPGAAGPTPFSADEPVALPPALGQ